MILHLLMHCCEREVSFRHRKKIQEHTNMNGLLLAMLYFRSTFFLCWLSWTEEIQLPSEIFNFD